MSDLNNLSQSQLAHQQMIAEWRAKQVHEHTLPSGLVVKMRDVDLLALAFNGDIPNTMLGMVEEIQKAAGVIQTDDLVKFGGLINRLAITCVVEPPLALEPDELHIGVNELSGPDRIDIFMHANREVGNLQTFRPVEDKPMDVIQPGEDIRNEAVQPTGA
jgi:hypothetical protein